MSDSRVAAAPRACHTREQMRCLQMQSTGAAVDLARVRPHHGLIAAGLIQALAGMGVDDQEWDAGWVVVQPAWTPARFRQLSGLTYIQAHAWPRHADAVHGHYL